MHFNPETDGPAFSKTILRRLARISILAEAKEIHKISPITESLGSRMKELNEPFKLMQAINTRLARLFPNLKSRKSDDYLELVETCGQHDEEDDTQDQFDIEEEFGSGAPIAKNPQARIDTDELQDLDTLFHIPYVHVVHTFVGMMLEEQLQPGDARPCPECLEGDTIPDHQKHKLYINLSSLKKDLSGETHVPINKWWRQAEVRRGAHAERKWTCPYNSCTKAYAERNELLKHMRESLKW